MSTPLSIRARWILPVEGPPMRDGILVVDGQRIAHVGPARKGDSGVDWGNVAILPALVNTHTHLEFSSLEEPLGTPAMPFASWIQRVVAWRRERDAAIAEISPPGPGKNAPDQRSSDHGPTLTAIQLGIAESLRGGVGTLGEIATSPLSCDILRRSAIQGIAFLELIGLSTSNIESRMEAARAYVNSQQDRAAAIQPGISPHAPYTVHPDLLRQIVTLSATKRFPVAMHLAETEAELQLLCDGTGSLREMLQSLNAWEPQAIQPRTRPLDYLRLLITAHRALAIHGNYLDDEEIRFLGQHADRISVVYCPRTHAYFGHSPYPLQKMLTAGVRVALGTDSRASNPNLSLLDELRFAAARDPGVDPQTWLQLATLSGAASVGLDTQCGSLRPGKVASFVAIRLPASETNDPWAWLEDPSCQVQDVFLRGLRIADCGLRI